MTVDNEQMTMENIKARGKFCDTGVDFEAGGQWNSLLRWTLVKPA